MSMEQCGHECIVASSDTLASRVSNSEVPGRVLAHEVASSWLYKGQRSGFSQRIVMALLESGNKANLGLKTQVMRRNRPWGFREQKHFPARIKVTKKAPHPDCSGSDGKKVRV
jgi:hypothetical protein